jgi:hypothetical protein
MMAREHPSAQSVRWCTAVLLVSAAIWLAMVGVILAATLLFR